jgi:hypothetical protein
MVIDTKYLCSDAQNTLAQFTCLLVMALFAGQFRESVQTMGYIRMVGTKGLFPDRSRLHEMLLCLIILPLNQVKFRKRVQNIGNKRVLNPKCLLSYRQARW